MRIFIGKYLTRQHKFETFINFEKLMKKFVNCDQSFSIFLSLKYFKLIIVIAEVTRSDTIINLNKILK